MILLLLAALLPPSVQVVSMRTETVGTRQKLVIEADAEWGAIAVQREGADVVASLDAETAASLAVPAAAGPVETIRLDRSTGRLQVRVTVGPDVPFEVRRDGPQLALLFGTTAVPGAPPVVMPLPAPATAPAPAPAPAPVEEAGTSSTPPALPPAGINPRILDLYRSLQPPSSPLTPDMTDLGAEESSAEERPGIGIGPLRFQPSVLVGYARSKLAVEDPTPVEDSYLQIDPRLGSQLLLLDGRFRATYEPQLRMNSRIAKINKPSHELNARLEIPFGGRFIASGSEHYMISTLDANEVDPGREYFFNLGRFTREDTGAGLDVEVGPRMNLRFGASRNRVRFREEAGFFSYEQRRASAGWELVVSEALRARLSYGVEEIPPPVDRPIAKSSSQTAGFALTGEILPLTRGDIAIGYRRENAPNAGEGGRHFSGITVSARVVKDFARGTQITLGGARGTNPSAFEENAFYVSNAVSAALDTQLPLAFSGRVGGGYHWNAYRTVSAALGVPRRDRMYGWTAGLSRPLSSWSYVRADYSWDRRDSNVPGLDNEGSMLLVQLGIGLFGGSSTDGSSRE